MATERTLSIIKPDAVAKNLIGKVCVQLEGGGLSIVASRMLHLSEEDAKGFYAVHSERPFFPELIKFMTSGRVVVQVLEGENAIVRNREIMGATDPAKAEEGTIRNLFGESIEANAVHGSDSPENARTEIGFFFPELGG